MSLFLLSIKDIKVPLKVSSDSISALSAMDDEATLESYFDESIADVSAVRGTALSLIERTWGLNYESAADIN